MGKRKRRADSNKTPPPPSDSGQHAPQVDHHLERRTSEPAESSATKHPPSFMDALNSSLNRSSLDQNHTLLLRHSRHSLGRHYSRRNSTNLSDASPSNWKGTTYDSKLSFKLARHELSDGPYKESRARTFQKPERIRSSTLSQNALSGDVRKMYCQICHKRLRKHPYVIENSISSSDLSVVAVLVCGHAYHGDCLDQKTNHEDRQDPICPLCVSVGDDP